MSKRSQPSNPVVTGWTGLRKLGNLPAEGLQLPYKAHHPVWVVSGDETAEHEKVHLGLRGKLTLHQRACSLAATSSIGRSGRYAYPGEVSAERFDLKGRELPAVLEDMEAVADHLAGADVAALLNLYLNELLEMIPDDET